MKNDQKPSHNAQRRDFLRKSAGTGVGVAVAAGLPAAVQAAAPEVEAESEQGKGYQLTDHVMAYYKTLAE